MALFKTPQRTLLSVLTLVVTVALMANLYYPLSRAATGSTSQPSAKVSCAVSDIKVASSDLKLAGPDGWFPILSTSLKTSNQADVFVDCSLETGLYTQTLVKSKNGVPDTSSAKAKINIRVVVDEKTVAQPGEVTFDYREQILSATLQGIIDKALKVDQNGGIYIDPTLVTPEEINLILDTMAAHAFNFVIPNLASGVHTIEVQAKIATGTSYQLGSAEARATIGKGSVTVDEVRMIQNASPTQGIDLP